MYYVDEDSMEKGDYDKTHFSLRCSRERHIEEKKIIDKSTRQAPPIRDIIL